MKKYLITTVPGPEVNWSEIPQAKVDFYKWDDAYRPETTAKVAVIAGQGLAVKLRCDEDNPRAVYHNFYDDVFKDSCLEFFFGFSNPGVYINCEMNANGASLIGVGDNRNDRTRLDAITVPPNIGASVNPGYWTVETYFSLEKLRAVFGDDISLDKGTKLYGNFFKCGDDCEPPHHLMWSPVHTDKPDFHRPEYFGELLII